MNVIEMKCKIIELEKEKLKKQLEEKTRIGVVDHKYASKCEDKVITMENQQQEFLKILNEKEKYFDNCCQPNTSGIIAGIKEIYLEIIGEEINER